MTYELPWMQPTNESTDEKIRRVHDVQNWPPKIQQLDTRLLSQIKTPASQAGI